jgi:hypothetical protein
MAWWKTAIYASVVWFGISLAAGAGLVWFITAHPMGPQIDEARFEKAGEMTGTMAGTGIGIIWLGLFVWSGRSRSSGRSKSPRR